MTGRPGGPGGFGGGSSGPGPGPRQEGGAAPDAAFGGGEFGQPMREAGFKGFRDPERDGAPDRDPDRDRADAAEADARPEGAGDEVPSADDHAGDDAGTEVYADPAADDHTSDGSGVPQGGDAGAGGTAEGSPAEPAPDER